jgi:hypothetical protein
MPGNGRSRISVHRNYELAPDEAKLLDDIEKHSCHILHVTSNEILPGWSYTIGLCEIFQQPEIIVVGLKTDTAQFLLNEVASRMRLGLKIREGLRQSELLADVECEFREVEQRSELAGVVGYAKWFYGADPFPVFQCIYPDLHNRFPWEEQFDASWRCRQALLFAAAESTGLENDFWAFHNPQSSLYDWNFSDPPHTGVYTTNRIMRRDEPIVYVSHDIEDGAWQFHGPSESKVESAALVCFHHIVDNDPSVKALSDLPRGWRASRDRTSDPWVREQKIFPKSSS